MLRKIFLTAMLISALLPFCSANFTTSRNIGTELGLSQNSANCIVQDIRGYLWVGTNDGLNQYDGYSVRVYKPSQFDTLGYHNNIINALYVDKDGNLWIGTQSNIYRYEIKNDRFVNVTIQGFAEHSNGNRLNVKSFIQKSNGDLIILANKKIITYSFKNNKAEELIKFENSADTQEYLTSIYEDSKNQLWLGTSVGVYLLNTQTNGFEPIPFSKTQTQHYIHNIIETNENEIILATKEGIFIHDNLNNVFRNNEKLSILSSLTVNVLLKDSNNNIWAGTANDGVFKLNENADKILSKYSVDNFLLGSNSIRSMCEDEFGIIWIGTSDRGVYSFSLSDNLIKRFSSNNRLLKNISSICGTNQSRSIWATTSNQGVIFIDYNDEDNVVISQPKVPLQSNFNRSSAVSIIEHDGTLYIGSETDGFSVVKPNGLNWNSLKTYKSIKTQNGDASLWQAKSLILFNDKVWFSNDNFGLCYFDIKTSEIVQYQLKADEKLCKNEIGENVSNDKAKELNSKNISISSISIGENGILWLGTWGNGLIKVNVKSEENSTFECISNKLFDHLFINSILVQNNILWIATQGYGLYEYNVTTEKVNVYTKSNGLSNDILHAIEVDNFGNIWLSSNNGISKFDLAKREIVNYTESFYLQSEEFNTQASYKNSDNTLFFGGNNGINYLNYTADVSTVKEPKIIISDLLINNEKISVGAEYNNRIVLTKAIDITEKINLHYKDKVVGFGISSIHFADPRNNIFMYQLEGYDKNWISRNINNRYISYNNLKGGTYTLRLKAGSSNGKWSAEKKIVIKVTPPLWQATWFKIFAYLGSLAIIISIFVVRNISQKKKRIEIEHERNMMQSLIDNIPDTIYFKDLQSKFTRINKAQAELLGLDNSQDAVGKSDFDFFKHAQEAYDIEQEIIRTGKPVFNQMNIVKKEGKDRYLIDTKIALYDSMKNCIGTVGVTRDVTDIKQTEVALLDSQAKFKALFDNAPLAIFRINKEHEIVEYNYRFRKMFGFSRDEAIKGIKFEEILIDPDMSHLIFETVVETKEVNSEIILKRNNGDSFFANMTLALVEEGFGDFSLEGIVDDVTKMVHAREEIIKSKDQAIEADRLKSLFLANMSHEIRTPMNAIIGFSNMLRESTITDEEKHSFIDVIISNGNSLLTLIDAILDFSKLEAKQMSISISEFNLNALFDSLHSMTEKSLMANEKPNIKLVLSKGSQADLKVHSDRHRLTQVMNYLISNAIKFTDEGEIEIGYRIVDKNIVEIFVRDTGIGIPEDKKEVVFERFTKLNRDKNRLYGGTGIGLTLSKGLITIMGGEIWVESKVGEGSTFIISLPITQKV